MGYYENQAMSRFIESEEILGIKMLLGEGVELTPEHWEEAYEQGFAEILKEVVNG